MNNNSKYTFKLIGFRCVTPKDTDTLMCVKNNQGQEISITDNAELFNSIRKEVIFNQRKLSKDGDWYFFYDGYTIDEDYNIKIDTPQVDASILYSNKLTTNVCCIVGKNGCGKTSIIEMVLKVLNNFYFATKSNKYKTIDDHTSLKYAENIFCDLIIDRNHTIYILSFRGRELTIRGWSIDDGVNIAAEPFTITNQVSTHGSDCLYNKSNQDYPFNDLDSIFNLFSYKYLETNKPSYIPDISRITPITELSNNMCIERLTIIPNNNYDFPIKLSYPDSNTNQNNNNLLNLCFYHEKDENGDFQYPLRSINKDCTLKGFVFKHKDILWPNVTDAFTYSNYSLKDPKTVVIDFLKEFYNITSNLAEEYKSLSNIVSTLSINALAARFIEKIKREMKTTIVKKWVETDEYYEYEKANLRDVIMKSGNEQILCGNDISNVWKKYKKDNEDWLNSDIIDYFIQLISDNYIIKNLSIDFFGYIIEKNNLKFLSSNVTIDKYMKIWKLLSNEVDVFLRNLDTNVIIDFESVFKAIQEGVIEFNGKRIDLNELKIDIYDLVFPLQLLDIDLVLLQKKDQTIRYFSGLSSGEKQLLSIRSNFIYNLIKIDLLTTYRYINAIFDEVEMFMHPEWQRKFLSRIIEGLNLITFKNIKSINILIATHSPFILSDVPKSNVLFIDENGNTAYKQNISETFGANIHDMFNNSFFMDSTLGEIAVKHIKEIVSQYDKAKLDKDYKDNNLKSEIEQNKAKYDYILSIISDKYYRYSIKSMLDYMYRKYNIHSYEDITKAIEEHKIALKRLQNELNHLE